MRWLLFLLVAGSLAASSAQAKTLRARTLSVAHKTSKPWCPGWRGLTVRPDNFAQIVHLPELRTYGLRTAPRDAFGEMIPILPTVERILVKKRGMSTEIIFDEHGLAFGMNPHVADRPFYAMELLPGRATDALKNSVLFRALKLPALTKHAGQAFHVYTGDGTSIYDFRSKKRTAIVTWIPPQLKLSLPNGDRLIVTGQNHLDLDLAQLNGR